MKCIKLFLIVLMITLALGCTKLKQQPLVTPETNVEAMYSGLSANDVQNAIIVACTTRGWKVDKKTKSQIDASILVRGKHYVFVSIPYSSKQVTIKYKDSSNMFYEGGVMPKIHHNYNKWVTNLMQTINLNLLSKSNMHKL